MQIVRVFKGDTENAEAAWDERVLIVLNLEHDAELYAQGLARTVVNRVQKLRKEVWNGVVQVMKGHPTNNIAEQLDPPRFDPSALHREGEGRR